MSKPTAKRPAAADTRAALLSRVAVAVWNAATARDAAVLALRNAGPDQDDVEATVIRSYMARRLNPGATEPTAAMLKQAKEVLALPGASTKAAAKRTVEQERFYTGARQMLWSLRKSAEVAATDPRGGANNTGPRDPQTPTPRAGKDEPASEVDVRNHVLATVSTLMAYVEKHERRSIVGERTKGDVAKMLKLAQALTRAK